MVAIKISHCINISLYSKINISFVVLIVKFVGSLYMTVKISENNLRDQSARDQ